MHKTCGPDQENVTALVTICTDGMALHLTITFKAKQFNGQFKFKFYVFHQFCLHIFQSIYSHMSYTAYFPVW